MGCRLAVSCAFLVLIGSAFAEEVAKNNSLSTIYIQQEDKNRSQTQPILPERNNWMRWPHDHRVQVGGNYSYCWIKPQGNSTMRGSLGGAQGIYEYRPLNFVYAAAAFGYRIGKTRNHAGSREIQDFNPQARVGYTYSNEGIVDRLTFFTGVGARYMPEKVKVGATSIKFKYTTFYVPVGFLFEQKVMQNFLVGCNFQWMPQVFPMVRIDPLDGAEWDLTYQLLNFYVEVPLILSLYKDRFTVSFSPFFETWRDGKSTAKTLTDLALALPGNKYYFAGVNVNFGYSF